MTGTGPGDIVERECCARAALYEDLVDTVDSMRREIEQLREALRAVMGSDEQKEAEIERLREELLSRIITPPNKLRDRAIASGA